jgi:ribonuclease-3
MSDFDVKDIIENITGYRFIGDELLRMALIHSSAAADKIECNERMEFLGDSILGMVVSKYLYDNFPADREGILTHLKSKIVSGINLSNIGRDLALDKLIVVDKGLQNNKIPDSIIADVFEALIAALYLEAGFEVTQNFIHKRLCEKIDFDSEKLTGNNSKSMLQEILQSENKPVPSYRVLKEIGPDHKKSFKVGVYIQGKKMCEADGFSKKEAEQKAAQLCIETLDESTSEN